MHVIGFSNSPQPLSANNIGSANHWRESIVDSRSGRGKEHAEEVMEFYRLDEDELAFVMETSVSKVKKG